MEKIEIEVTKLYKILIQRGMTQKDLHNLIKETNGKFFTVTFIKKDGTERTMNARLGVKVYLRGGQLEYDAEEKGLIPVYDVKTKGYRMVNVSTITNLKIGKNEYTVE